MMRFLKQRWVVALLAVGATLLFLQYVYPKIKSAAVKPSGNTGSTTDPAPAPPAQSLKTRLVGPVTASTN